MKDKDLEKTRQVLDLSFLGIYLISIFVLFVLVNNYEINSRDTLIISCFLFGMLFFFHILFRLLIFLIDKFGIWTDKQIKKKIQQDILEANKKIEEIPYQSAYSIYIYDGIYICKNKNEDMDMIKAMVEDPKYYENIDYYDIYPVGIGEALENRGFIMKLEEKHKKHLRKIGAIRDTVRYIKKENDY
jgi:hypothetical protein